MNLRTFFFNLKIRVKLLLAFGSLILLLVATVIVFFNTLRQNNKFQQASEDIDDVSIALLEMDAALKYFMLEGYKEESFQKDHQSNYLDLYKSSLMHTGENFQFLRSGALNLEDSLTRVEQMLGS
ncbi:MAG TPA: hypothetical protein VFU05_15495, partial [Cyclobacteriaceae bacterium]|nr:hypothetical protein [Cyclobacteriaceae bacterium]